MRASSRKQQTSGIKCGFRQVVLPLVFCLISRKVLKVGIYKYAHRRLKRMQHHLLQEKLSRSFAGKSKFDFWNNINKLKKPSKPHEIPVIDGVSGPCHIANLFDSKLDVTLNTHSSASRDSLISIFLVSFPSIFGGLF